MNHQPFETWIFSDQSLEQEQQTQLISHLSECVQCRTKSDNLAAIHSLFMSSTPPAPSPGFTQRWHTHLSNYRQKRQQSGLWVFALSLLGVGSLIFLALILHSLMNMNWTFVLSLFIANLSLFAARIRNFWNFINTFVDAFPFLIPIIIIFGVGGLSVMTALIVTWFSSIIRLYQPNQEGVTL